VTSDQDVQDNILPEDPISNIESDDNQEQVSYEDPIVEAPTDNQTSPLSDTDPLGDTRPNKPSTSQPSQEQQYAMLQQEYLRYQQQASENDNRTAQLEAQQINQYMQQQAIQYRNAMLQQGFSQEDAQRNTNAFQQLQQQKFQINKERQEIQDQAMVSEYERLAKWEFAQHYHKEYGVPINELMKANTEPEMENMGLKAQNSKVRQGQVPPQKRMDSNRPSPHASNNRDRQLDALQRKDGDWTNADFALYDKLKG
jgi:hypothetical protein